MDHLTGRKAQASIDISSSGDNTVIVAPETGAHIEIDHILFVAAGAVDIILKDGSTDKTGAMTFGASGTFAFDNGNAQYPFEITTGNGFVINLSAGVQVSGWVFYRVVGES